jgi:hypothetical protein
MLLGPAMGLADINKDEALAAVADEIAVTLIYYQIQPAETLKPSQSSQSTVHHAYRFYTVQY